MQVDFVVALDLNRTLEDLTPERSGETNLFGHTLIPGVAATKSGTTMLKRRVITLLIALTLVLAGVRAVEVTLRAQRRAAASRRLAIALGGFEWAPIRSLLLEGADPRARGETGETALSWALNQNDVSVTRRVLLEFSADPLAAVREIPPIPTRNADPAYSLEEMQTTLEELVRQPVPAPLNAWLGLAVARHRLGKYAAAATAYRRTLRFDPANHLALVGLADAERAEQAAEFIQPVLPPGATLLRAFHLHDERWLAVWASVANNGGESQFGAVRAGVYRTSKSQARALGEAVPIADPRWPESAAARLAVCFHDLTGDRRPELVVEFIGEGASWTPSCLQIFSLQNGRPLRILRVTSSSPLWMEDLDHNGTLEVGNSYEIGTEMSHAEQPRWEDIYAFDGRLYVQANRRFPGEFRNWEVALASVLRDHPDDGQIREYLGRTHEILGRPILALRSYRQAEQAYSAMILNEDSNSTYHRELERRRQGVRERARALAPRNRLAP